MRPTAHLISGAVMGCVVWSITQNMNAAIGCGLGNVISDTDHLLEYGLYCLKRRHSPRLQEFMSGKYFAEKGTLIVIFHGHEHFLALAFMCIYLHHKGHTGVLNLTAFTIGYGMHMLLDLIGNDCGFRGYSFFYRIAAKFSEQKICGRK